MKSSVLVRIALSASLVMVSFYFFRGIANLLNAVTVPLVLYGCGMNLVKRERLFMNAGVLMTGIILFPRQVFFLMGYVLIASAITTLLRSKMTLLMRFVILSVFLAGVLHTGLLLTDAVFNTGLVPFFLALFQGRWSYYTAMVAGEGILVAFLLLNTATVLDKQLGMKNQRVRQDAPMQQKAPE